MSVNGSDEPDYAASVTVFAFVESLDEADEKVTTWLESLPDGLEVAGWTTVPTEDAT